VNRRRFLQVAAIGTAAAAVGTVGYTLAVEPHWLEITERELPIAHLPDALVGARLVQLSDLHIGPQVSDIYLRESFARIRAIAPEIVVVTGDFITYFDARGAAQFDHLRDVLTDFPNGRVATLGILGNHDYGTNWRDVVVASKVVAEAERAGIRMLRNETHAVNGLDVIGVDDLWARRSDTARAFTARSNDAALVLVHNPDAADKLAWPDYRGWMLSGHTHGGQCKAPFLPPPLLPVENKRYVAGAVCVDDARTLYISRGVGHLIKARFNVRPEITVFTLRRQADT
jgi:predicted MPP superfamily phosphohydrolase